MSKTENKVKFGLKNVHYAVGTDNGDGTLTYAKPVAFPGAKALTMDPEGDSSPFYADDMKYYVSYANNGYTGSLEMTRIIDRFRQDVLKDYYDSKGVLVENAGAKTVAFALLFEFNGDQQARRHVIYNVQAGRPSVSSQTTESSKEPQTESVDITASPLKNGIVKVSTTPKTDEEVYNKWYEEVYIPSGAYNEEG